MSVDGAQTHTPPETEAGVDLIIRAKRALLPDASPPPRWL